jgi:LPS O-antigen subunit length determinant protein (WzzB/FepE family)
LIKNISTFPVLDYSIKISKNITLGAYYIKSYFLIKKKIENYKKIAIRTLKDLKELTEHFIEQFNKYLELIDNINNNNNNYKLYLSYQTSEKKYLMKELSNNLEENIDKIEKVMNQSNYSLNVNNGLNQTNNNVDFEIKITQKISFNELDKPISKDIIDYFIDYGLCGFFHIECYKISYCEKILNIVLGQ